MSKPVQLIRPDKLGLGDNAVSPPGGGWHMLAEGDSWFSFGSVLGNSLLNQLHFERSTLVTATSMPGDTLRHMVDWRRDPQFVNLVDGGRRGSLAWTFDAVLLSAGGNDLIDAVNDKLVDQQLIRLVAPGSEPGSAAECIHEDAWQRFEAYLRANFAAISQLVGNSAKNAATPIFIHGYDYPIPVGHSALGGIYAMRWMRKPFDDRHYDAQADLPAATKAMRDLIDALNVMLSNLHRTYPFVRYVDLRTMIETGKAIDPKVDWFDDLHPTSEAFRLLAAKIEDEIEKSRKVRPTAPARARARGAKASP